MKLVENEESLIWDKSHSATIGNLGENRKRQKGKHNPSREIWAHQAGLVTLHCILEKVVRDNGKQSTRNLFIIT